MKNKVAIIGSGPTCIYFLKQLSDQPKEFKSHLHSITIFEKSNNAGMEMPYNPEMTDFYNLSNISSEEIPALEESFADWLRNQPKGILNNLNVTEFPISKSKVYSRIALGNYFRVQFEKIIKKLKKQDLWIDVMSGVEIIDIITKFPSEVVSLEDSNHRKYDGFNKVIISTGHIWAEKDQTNRGYYASPWPIQKILPSEETYYNFPIGTLGASLSAFDVVTSLAHRHGSFEKSDEVLTFKLNKNVEQFKLVMHSAEGWLPHLQYEQEKPIREIYRHASREEILALIDSSGFLSLSVYFDKICRPALIIASSKDGNPSLIKLLSQISFGMEEFVKYMEKRHEYVNSFEGMRKEQLQAKEKMNANKPTHWMETLDDLMYALNFHAELLSAEDHLFLNKRLMPFLMNVIAALPLPSAQIILALYDAGCISLKKGFVEIIEDKKIPNKTVVKVTDEGKRSETLEYSMFVNCSGQGKLEFENYPFPSLINENKIRKSRAEFKAAPDPSVIKEAKKKDQILSHGNKTYLYTGGIDVDAGYRVIDVNGEPSTTIRDVSFIHTSGCRPYSYGLQACNATSTILMEQFKKDFKLKLPNKEMALEEITRIYDSNDNL